MSIVFPCMVIDYACNQRIETVALSEKNKCEHSFLELLVVKFGQFHKFLFLQIAEEKMLLHGISVESYIYISNFLPCSLIHPTNYGVKLPGKGEGRLSLSQGNWEKKAQSEQGPHICWRPERLSWLFFFYLILSRSYKNEDLRSLPWVQNWRDSYVSWEDLWGLWNPRIPFKDNNIRQARFIMYLTFFNLGDGKEMVQVPNLVF